LANVDIQLGLTPERDLSNLVGGTATLADTVVHHAQGGFDILAGRSGCGALAGMDAAALDGTLTALQEASAGYDLTLLDLGAGVERPVRRLAAWADLLLVLATEEPTSLTDAYAVLKLHAADCADTKARIVVNQASSRAAGERTYATLRRACTTFLRRDPPLAGIIRRDDRVRDAIRRQTLLLSRHPGSPAALDVEAVAQALL
jgi:flagellar biosynthesis protein FlhG